MARTTRNSDEIAKAWTGPGRPTSSQVQGWLEAGHGAADLNQDQTEHFETLTLYLGRGDNGDVADLKMAALHRRRCLGLTDATCSLLRWSVERLATKPEMAAQLQGQLTQLARSAGAPPEWAAAGMPEAKQWKTEPGLAEVVVDSALSPVRDAARGEPVDQYDTSDLTRLANANLERRKIPHAALSKEDDNRLAAGIVNSLPRELEESIRTATPQELVSAVALANVFVDNLTYSAPVLATWSEKDRWGLVAQFTPMALTSWRKGLKEASEALGFSELLAAMRFDSPPALKDAEE